MIISTNLYCQNYQLILHLTLIKPLQCLHYKGNEHIGGNWIVPILGCGWLWNGLRRRLEVWLIMQLEQGWAQGQTDTRTQNLKQQWRCFRVCKRKVYAASNVCHLPERRILKGSIYCRWCSLFKCQGWDWLTCLNRAAMQIKYWTKQLSLFRDGLK